MTMHMFAPACVCVCVSVSVCVCVCVCDKACESHVLGRIDKIALARTHSRTGRRQKIETLYDAFINIRDDEKQVSVRHVRPH